MEFKAENKPKIAILLDKRIEITFTTENANLSDFEKIPDKELLVKVQPYSRKRSLSQNGYMWVLIGELSKKLGIAKDQIYKSYIKDYGIYEVLPIKQEAVNRFIETWTRRGLGWVCEVLKESKLKGYVNVIAYYGSSTYNASEMATLLDAIVMDCEEQGINTMTLSDILMLPNDYEASN